MRPIKILQKYCLISREILAEGMADSEASESTVYRSLLLWPHGNVKIYYLALFLATPALK